jgi:hypothetical protein
MHVDAAQPCAMLVHEEVAMIDEPQFGLIREVYGRLVYTHKTHEKERERLSRFSIIAKWVNIVLSALTFGGITVALGTDEWGWRLASALLAVAAAGFAVFQLSFDPARSAEAHRTAAKRFLELRNAYETLIADILSEAISDEDLRRRRDELSEKVNDAFRAAPDSSHAAYARAQKALSEEEEMTFAEGEIASFLPGAMRRNPPEVAGE